MKKTIIHTAFALTALSLAHVAIAAPRASQSGLSRHASGTSFAKLDNGKQKVKIELVGADNAQNAAITKVLTDSGLKAKVHDGKGKKKPMHLAAEIDPAADLSQWSKLIGSTTPKGQVAPTLELVLYAPITKETGTQALAQLESVKGVDVKHSTADVKLGELHVALTGNDHVTAKDITSAVQAGGVVARFAPK